MKWDLISFVAGVGGGVALAKFWAGTIRPYILGEVNIIISGAKGEAEKVLAAIRAKL